MEEHKFLTVEKLLREKGDFLKIEILAGHKGLDNKIFKPRGQRLGLVLAGYMDKIDPESIQILGETELEYLLKLDKEERIRVFFELSLINMCSFLITKGLEPPIELVKLSNDRGIPLLRSSLKSFILVRRLINYLEEELANESSVHGTFLDIFGVGVIIMGKSGIGKSECALELVARGHQLVSDDIVKIKLLPPNILIGTGFDLSRYLLEIRGVGIIDIKKIFGISSIREKKELELAILLDEWKEEEYDRVGLERHTTEFLGIKIPMIRMLVAPGRNLAIILEVAVRNYLLLKEGVNSAEEFDQRIKRKSSTNIQKNL